MHPRLQLLSQTTNCKTSGEGKSQECTYPY